MLIDGSGTSRRPRQPAPGPTNPVKSGQEGIGFLVNQTARAFQHHMGSEIRQFNIAMPGYVVLRHLLREIDASPAGVDLHEMGRKLLMHPHDIAEATERLERDGWLKSRRAGESTFIKPTVKATRIAPVLSASSHWMLEQALSGFSREEIEQLAALLVRVLRNMGSPLGADEGPLGF